MDNHNVLSICLLLLYWVWDDYIPAVKVIVGVITGIWLLYQLLRGLEKRKEEKQKRREEKEKHELEMKILRKKLGEAPDTSGKED